MTLRQWIVAPLFVGLLTAAGCSSGTDKRLSGSENPCELIEDGEIRQYSDADMRDEEFVLGDCIYFGPKKEIVAKVRAGVPGVPAPDGPPPINPDIELENTDVDGVPARQARFKDGKSCKVAALLDPEANDQAIVVDFRGDDACEVANELASKIIDDLPG